MSNTPPINRKNFNLSGLSQPEPFSTGQKKRPRDVEVQPSTPTTSASSAKIPKQITFFSQQEDSGSISLADREITTLPVQSIGASNVQPSSGPPKNFSIEFLLSSGPSVQELTQKFNDLQSPSGLPKDLSRSFLPSQPSKPQVAEKVSSIKRKKDLELARKNLESSQKTRKKQKEAVEKGYKLIRQLIEGECLLCFLGAIYKKIQDSNNPAQVSKENMEYFKRDMRDYIEKLKGHFQELKTRRMNANNSALLPENFSEEGYLEKWLGGLQGAIKKEDSGGVIRYAMPVTPLIPRPLVQSSRTPVVDDLDEKIEAAEREGNKKEVKRLEKLKEGTIKNNNCSAKTRTGKNTNAYHTHKILRKFILLVNSWDDLSKDHSKPLFQKDPSKEQVPKEEDYEIHAMKELMKINPEAEHCIEKIIELRKNGEGSR